ncbi:hypothetical protein [Cryobacterium sp. Y11]|uniref:hypothetical protein n=1 Tax=Cryobacterium sp. Y11 TaxID=2045016 RepID=UPI001304DE5F|nr:hypothetical protein [Cryobacterium sp. Y11]
MRGTPARSQDPDVNHLVGRSTDEMGDFDRVNVSVRDRHGIRHISKHNRKGNGSGIGEELPCDETEQNILGCAVTHHFSAV